MSSWLSILVDANARCLAPTQGQRVRCIELCHGGRVAGVQKFHDTKYSDALKPPRTLYKPCTYTIDHVPCLRAYLASPFVLGAF